MEKNQKRLIAKVKTTNGSFGTPVSTDLGAVYDKLRSGDNAERVRKIAFQATVSALAEGECDGTRRYLCVELTGVIDTDTPVNYPRLYAQAMHELAEGRPFHFFPHEEAEIQAHNSPYQQQTSATEVLLAYFAPAPHEMRYFMKAVDIQKELSRHLRSEDVPSIKQLTVTLKRCGFTNRSISNQRGWYAKHLNN